MSSGRSQNLIHVFPVDHCTTLGALGLGPKLATQVVDVNLPISELLHRLEAIPAQSLVSRNLRSGVDHLPNLVTCHRLVSIWYNLFSILCHVHLSHEIDLRIRCHVVVVMQWATKIR